MKNKKTISYNNIIKFVLHDPEVDSWPKLYEKLGVFKWFEERDTFPDVRHIFMTQRMVQYISLIFEDKYATAKKRSYDRFARNTSKWDSLNFGPCDIDNDVDCMILDLSDKTRAKLAKNFDNFVPNFKRG